MEDFTHQPVLLNEVIEHLNVRRDGIYVDATFGRGGHSRAILQQLGDNAKLIAFDKDPDAEKVAEQLQQQDKRFNFYRGSFTKIEEQLEKLNLVGKIQGVLLDLGVSSPQLEDKERGFSFLRDGPLDMRMDPTQGLSAKEWIAKVTEIDLATVFKEYGEERFSKRIAKAILREREEKPITRTLELAEIIKQANPKWEKDKHPATRCFQAIRIFINSELSDLQHVLPQTIRVLASGGRLAVISFHSLEDRIVKRFIREKQIGDSFPKDLPINVEALKPELTRVTKAIKAQHVEIENNSRARSAVLRVAEKI